MNELFNKNRWLTILLTVVFSGFYALANIYEFINVYILNNTKDYPFGGEGSAPWFYESMEMYAIVCFITGGLFMIITGLSIWFALKNKNIGLIICFLLILLFNIISVLYVL